MIRRVLGTGALDPDPYRVLERWAYDTPGEGEAQELKLQKTRWVYGPPAGAGTGESEISSGALLWKIAYPDPETGEAHFDPENPDRAEDAPYQVTLAYDREGQVRWKRTQAYKPAEGPPDPEDASVFEYEYDQYSGRLLAERVTHFRTGVDEALDAVSWTYDRPGRLSSVVTKSGEAVLSEVAFEYGGFGEVLRSYEEHGGAKTPSSLRVEYAYSADGIRRLEGVVYPDDVGLTPARKTVYYRYSPANPPKCELASDRLVRVSRIALDDPSNPGNPHFSNALSYEHAGLERVVGKSYDMAGSGATTWRLYDSRSAGQAYNGLDRWGRTKEIWVRGSGTLRSHLSYSYNELGSVTARMEELSNLYDETYAYDGLERLSSQTVTRPSTGWSQTKTWELSLLGNWRRAAIQGGVSDTRTHNRENEVATRTYGSNDVAPEYDVRGNTTVVPRDSSSASTPCAKVVYDAWDRPVKVHEGDNAQNVYAHYRYDGFGRVIWRKLRDASGNFFERHYYYSDGWQVLSERASAQAGSSYRKMDYVWGVAYVDEIVSRLEYSGGSAVRKDFVQDANWNVVMLLSASGTVDERYRYDPYGDPVFLSASGNVNSSGILNATYLFQGRSLLDWRAPGGSLPARTYHYRHREHLAVLSRFAQRDPLGYGRGSNLYQALGSRPIVGVDLSGTQTEPGSQVDPDEHSVSYSGESTEEVYIPIAYSLPASFTIRYNKYSSPGWGPIEIDKECRDPLCKGCSGTLDEGPTHQELAESVRKACDAYARALEAANTGKTVPKGAKPGDSRILQGAIDRCKKCVKISCECCCEKGGGPVEARAWWPRVLDVMAGIGGMDPRIYICAPPVKASIDKAQPWRNAAFCDDKAGGRMNRADKALRLIIHELSHLGGAFDPDDGGGIYELCRKYHPFYGYVDWDDPRNAYSVEALVSRYAR